MFSQRPDCERNAMTIDHGELRPPRMAAHRGPEPAQGRSADFQICRIAGFETCAASAGTKPPLVSEPCRFGNRRYSGFGNLRYGSVHGKAPSSIAWVVCILLACVLMCPGPARASGTWIPVTNQAPS